MLALTAKFAIYPTRLNWNCKKHTIEIVVDRFKVRNDIATRLAESFETALFPGGTVVVADMDNPDVPELVFSANFACPHCGYSIPELEPRLFSLQPLRGLVRPVMDWAYSILTKNA